MGTSGSTTSCFCLLWPLQVSYWHIGGKTQQDFHLSPHIWAIFKDLHPLASHFHQESASLDKILCSLSCRSCKMRMAWTCSSFRLSVNILQSSSNEHESTRKNNISHRSKVGLRRLGQGRYNPTTCYFYFNQSGFQESHTSGAKLTTEVVHGFASLPSFVRLLACVNFAHNS